MVTTELARKVEMEDFLEKFAGSKKLFDALMLTHGVSMPAFHTAMASLPMGTAELALFEKAMDLSLSDMKKLGEI